MPYRRIGFSDRLSTSVKDVSGALADPGALILKIKDPAGVVTTHNWTGDIVRDGLGLFHYDLAGLTTLGLYRYKWNATGANTGVSPNLTYFTLVDEWTPLLLTIEGARSQVNQSATDADLELYVDSAVETMETGTGIGPIIPRTTTENASYLPSEGKLLLPTHIVPGSITAATQGGSATSVVGWTAGRHGVVVLPTPSYLYSGAITVSYTAGFDPIPTPLKEAAALRAQHSYETQRGPGEGPFAEQLEGGGSAFLLLVRAREKEAPYVFPAVA